LNLSSHISSSQETVSLGQFRLRSLQTFFIGFGAGWIVNLLMGIFPAVLATLMPQLSAASVASGILAISAILSIWLGPLTARLGIVRSLLFGLFGMVGLMGLMTLHLNTGAAILLTIAFGCSFGVVFISTIPFALGRFPPDRGNWGTGLYFGGGGLAAALFSTVQKIAPITPIPGFALAAIGAFFVLFCLRRELKSSSFRSLVN
jgi:Na+/melibiose symporter-like transporter